MTESEERKINVLPRVIHFGTDSNPLQCSKCCSNWNLERKQREQLSPMGCIEPTNTSLCILPSSSSMANQRFTGNSYTSLFPMSSITTWINTQRTAVIIHMFRHGAIVQECVAARTLSRNQPAEEPLLLWPMVIFFILPRLGDSIVNLSSDPRSKLSLSLSNRLSP